MNETTYGQLDRAIRALGFTRREVKLDVDAVVYTHPHSKAVIMLPPFPENQPVYPHHLLMVETELDNFGHATPTAFAAELQKAG
jgi:hypothetical protein